jgi:hypothetical protein
MLIPADWDDYSEWQRAKYYTQVTQNSQSLNRNDQPISKEDLQPMNAVSTKELLDIPLNTNNNSEICITNINAKKVSNAMTGIKEWKSGKNIKLDGKRLRGYKRI